MNQNSETGNSPGIFGALTEVNQMQILNFVSITNIEDLELAVRYMEEYSYDLNVYSIEHFRQ